MMKSISGFFDLSRAYCKLCVAGIGFLLSGQSSLASTVNVLNIQWQPYFYKNHDEISGYAKDIVAQVVKKAGVEANYQLKNWETVYEDGITAPNTVIAGVGRIESRESLFHWIGPVNKETTIYAYGLKSKNIQLSGIKDLGGYITAVERNMYYHDFMIKMGFEDQTYPVSDIASLIKLLNTGRVDFILLEEERMQMEFARLGYHTSDIEAKALAFSAQSYMTLSKSTEKALVDRFKTAYQQLERIGEITLY